MRSLVFLSLLVGCMPATIESRGAMRREMAGTVPLVFTNASPEPMCELHLSFDDSADYGDNWLPAGGLPSGQSLDVKVKPGKYKATWSTCRAKGRPYYAGTMWRETAVAVSEPTQLFAYVASNRAPTSIAPPREYHKMVRFAGQAIDLNPQPAPAAIAMIPPFFAPEPPSAPPPQPEPVVEKLDPKELASWIDPKARVAKPKTTAMKAAMKPSIGRGHDVGNQTVGYRQR